MVERILLFKLKDPSTRKETASIAIRALSALRMLEELSVGVPADESSAKSWDISVVMGFATADDLQAALGHPLFHSFLQHDMAERYEVLKAWSFERVEEV